MFIRNYDPAVDPNAAAGGAEPIKFTADNPPKNKEDWNQLAKDDPSTWINLTQHNTDRLTREKRELEQKLAVEQQEKENLAAEVNRFKVTPIVPPVVDKNQPFSANNFPKTEQEWDALALERPTFAADLRYAYLNRQTAIDTDFNRAHANYRKEVQAEHPDMYLTELDEVGQPKKDENGKLVLKLGANGEPLFNPNSEKGKLWEQIFNESRRPDGTNPLLTLPNAPSLMQAELERRLVKKGQSMIQAQTPKQNQVAAPGVPPPVSIKVAFKSKEEELHVEKSIERGVYKSKEQYCQIRDGEPSGYYEESSRPDFNKK